MTERRLFTFKSPDTVMMYISPSLYGNGVPVKGQLDCITAFKPCLYEVPLRGKKGQKPVSPNFPIMDNSKDIKTH